ncbi:hypothetical protein I4U23_006407 [Adineta vaga]|nr:hypothetical protein I4U23_006407 [Adineta vaga]
MFVHLWLLLVFLKYSFSEILITNYPTVDLLENSPLNTLIIHLTTSLNLTRTSKLVLLNMSGFELDMFTIINGSIYTIDVIDREEFLRNKYCLDSLYCKIELHILVNDRLLAYWVIPIHIVDENDNKPEFPYNEIELKFRENILHGYKIPFTGGRDLDEDNYLSTFSLVSTTSLNTYVLKTRRYPISKAIYMLNIGVKHKLSQQWLPNLRIEFIVVDQWSTTTMTTSTIITTTNFIITNTTIYTEPSGFCIENKNYILYGNENEIGFLRVIESNFLVNDNRSLISNVIVSMNSSEIIINSCRMHLDHTEYLWNTTLRYQICLLTDENDCYNISFTDEINREPLKINENDLKKWLLPMKPIEIVMFVLSIIFILITIILIFLICRLKGIHICLTIKNYLFYGKKYGLNNPTHSTTSPSKITQQVNSIVIRESRSPSCEPIRIENDTNEPYIFNIDHLLDREPHPSSNMFTLPSPTQISSSSSLTCSLQRENRTITTPRTSSSSSFLQETKQLLEMISSNPNSESLRMASDV